jgi:hypothetical protein
MPERTFRKPHEHLVNMPCLRYWDCERTGPEMSIAFGPITGVSEVARQLILLDTAREIFAERGIPIPAEVDALPPIPEKRAPRKRGRRTTGSKPGDTP